MSIFKSYPRWLIFLAILGIRLQNALTIRTFFQPDEYFQSLEIAASWRENSPGYVTWEWHHALRSVLYPKIFQGVYILVDAVSEALRLSPATQAELLVVAPKIVGAITAAIGDLYTGLLAQKIWGDEAGGYALLFSICSAWNWFCSTRTFSNCFETTLTVIGMTYWPWTNFNTGDLTLASIFAALAFTVRPTNGLISWAIGPLILNKVPSFKQRVIAVLQIAAISAVVLLTNAAIDYSFYGRVTFPFVEFYRLNVTQSISEFYGVSPWHYHHTQSIPLLLTGYLPLALYSLYKGFSSQNDSTRHLTILANIVPVAFMVTKHKEFRFLYPLLPIFHVLMAGVGLPGLPSSWKKERVVLGMVLLNIPIALYTTYWHQRGVVDVINWLRTEHYASTQNSKELEVRSTPGPQEDIDWAAGFDFEFERDRIGFLMPCHSTPFGSHLWDAAMRHRINRTELAAWFLTCEPPLGQSMEERKVYRDEADQFYDNPIDFLKERFGQLPIHGYHPPETRNSPEFENLKAAMLKKDIQWPDKLVTFEATAKLIQEYLLIDDVKGRYNECKRFFNSHFHDDWRRQGDVIVWCLDPEDPEKAG
ncbi:hypothetical protein ABW19_dt0202430 [Dactylella cylindrospora]|nr:hypothetical protein ABW19_dt0202430 [Dactylella cylindrospora]